MGFNPYNHEAYQDIGRAAFNSLPESIQQTYTSAAISGINYFLDVRRQAEENERNAQGWYMSQDRRLHKNSRSALEGGLASDMINGQRDCTTNDEWHVDW